MKSLSNWSHWDGSSDRQHRKPTIASGQHPTIHRHHGNTRQPAHFWETCFGSDSNTWVGPGRTADPTQTAGSCRRRAVFHPGRAATSEVLPRCACLSHTAAPCGPGHTQLAVDSVCHNLSLPYLEITLLICKSTFFFFSQPCFWCEV